MQTQREQLAEQMVEQQVRAWEVLDPAVLGAMQHIPRDAFLPEKLKNVAYSDVALQVRDDFLLPCPSVQGRILQTLELETDDSVCLIGSGAGYLSACLAYLSGHVTVSEADQALLDDLVTQFAETGQKNITLIQQDRTDALAINSKKYDAITSQYAFTEIPDTLKQALKINGRAVLFEGISPVISCVSIERIGETEFLTQTIFETDLTEYPIKHKPVFTF